ncbi:MAG TPA: DUF4255 domain-containing protein [Pyrinomonadaceae bacterium]|nr:DUF4255 domain-containing protein [Pyrinomonadaceae bacterium]
MAGFAGIAAAGKSIEMLVSAGFEELQPVGNPALPGFKKTSVRLVNTVDFEKSALNIGTPALSIFLYRVDFNKVMRAALSAAALEDGRSHLGLDLHYMITPWADNAEDEHRILGRAMQCMESSPILNGPMLHSSGEWQANDSIQVVLEEVSTEALMRIFDSLPTDYRLSVPYIARIMRLDGREVPTEGPVIKAFTGLVPTTQL